MGSLPSEESEHPENVLVVVSQDVMATLNFHIDSLTNLLLNILH